MKGRKVDTAAAEAAAELEIARATHMIDCYQSFSHFVRAFWHVVEPSKPLIWGWWMDVICAYVQKQQEGDPEYRWLLVMQPPGTAKSRVLSVLKSAWVMLRRPTNRMLYVSTSDSVASRDSRFTRLILKSEGWEPPEPGAEYRCGFRNVVRFLHEVGKKQPKGTPLHRYPHWDFAKDQDVKENFANDQLGSRQCMPMGAGPTGERGDDLTIDDPVDFEKIRGGSPATISANMKDLDVKARYLYTTRVNDRELSTRTMVAQRLDPDDPMGTAIRDGKWKIVCIPMEYDPTHPVYQQPEDPRTVAGEVLVGWYTDPQTGLRVTKLLQTDATRSDAVRDLGLAQYEAQYNQKPRRAASEFVTEAQLSALEEYDDDPQKVGRSCDELMITADFTFDSTENADRVAIHCWGRAGPAKFYLLDRDCRRMNYVEMKAALRWMKNKWPATRRIRVEKAAAGPMIRSDLQSEIPGIVLVPTGVRSKIERARVALQPLILGCNIVLPSADVSPWVREVKQSWLHMRANGTDDDDVDAAALMGAQWGMGGIVDPQWMTATSVLVGDGPNVQPEDGEWFRATGGVPYVLCAGPNPATGAHCSWALFRADTAEEVGSWMGTCDVREWAHVLVAVASRFNDAFLVIHNGAPGTVDEATRTGYSRVWQDSDNVRMRPGWWRNTSDTERAVASLSRLLTTEVMEVRSREGRQHLLAWDGNPDVPVNAGNARVLPYIMAADMIERLNRLRPKVVDQGQNVKVELPISWLLKPTVRQSGL